MLIRDLIFPPQNDLIDVVAAIELSKRTVYKIRMNFIWAILYNGTGWSPLFSVKINCWEHIIFKEELRI